MSSPDSPIPLLDFGSSRYLRQFLATNPALLILICFMSGIYLEESVGLPEAFVLLLFGTSGGVWFLFSKQQKPSIQLACLLVFCLMAGGTRLALFYSSDSADDITRLLQQEKRLIKLEGRVSSRPVLKQRRVAESSPEWMRTPKTTFLFDCEMLVQSVEKISVQGRCWVTVQGELTGIQHQDRVELVGWLSSPQPAMNQGEFDFRAYLRQHGIQSVLYVKTPEAIRVISPRSGFQLSYWADLVKRNWEEFSETALSPENQPLAAAMLLGTRDDLPQEMADEFARTGTMHFLAVSGLHVGILAMFLYGLCLLFRVPSKYLPWVLMLCIWGYAFLTEMRPPVMRASLLFSFMWVGRLLIRQASWLQLLSLTALFLLLMNPTQMFHVGAQLSFLAVCGIIWIGPVLKQESAFERDFSSGWEKVFRSVRKLFLFSFGIWLFTAPVTLSHFHLISPVGLLLNVVLMPVMAPVLFLGYLTVLLSFISPMLAMGLAWLFDLCLTLFTGTIQLAAEPSWGNRYSAGPQSWWVIGYYLILVLLYYFGCRTRFLRGGPAVESETINSEPKTITREIFQYRWTLLGGWVSLGLLVAMIPFSSGILTVHVFAVGHGSAVLVEFPNGKRLLYDAGSLDGGNRAANAVENCLFESGNVRLDMVVVSHADIDHFNAVPRIGGKVPVGMMCCSSHFLDYNQQAVAQYLKELEKSETPVSLIQQGDTLELDPAVSVEVLHPSPRTVHTDDNDNSIVLLISYANRKILLTGDLERAGQQEMMSGRKLDVDLLTAPHHGAREANEASFYDWSQPEYVTVSSGRQPKSSAVTENCSSCEKVYFTVNSGEIKFHIHPDGQIEAEPFRQKP